MIYPILAAEDAWFTNGAATADISKDSIVEINIVDSYIPSANAKIWDGSDGNGGITVCVEGDRLTIVGNGSSKISANPDSYYAFRDFTSLTDIVGADKLDTSFVTTMNQMFFKCKSLKNIDVSTWNTSSVTNMFGAFRACTSLEVLDMSSWDVSRVTTMASLFQSSPNNGLMKLKSIGDVSGWDTSKVTSFNSMFSYCANLEHLNISKWNSSEVVNTGSMFLGCTSLKSLDLSGWDVGKNNIAAQMFLDCTSLETLNLEGWKLPANADITRIFGNCASLTALNVGNLVGDNAAATNAFLGVNSLRELAIGNLFGLNRELLPTPSSDYIEGADGNWYAFNGDCYSTANIPYGNATTYYASPIIVDNLDVITKNGYLIAIAKSIRSKSESENRYEVNAMSAAIDSLSGSPVVIELTDAMEVMF